MEKNADIPVTPREEAGIYLTLEGNPGALSQFDSHLFSHQLKIRPDFLVRFECQPRINSQHEGSSDALVAKPKRAQCPKFNSAGGLKPLWQLERKAEFNASTHVETWLPVLNSIHSPRPTSEQERNPEVPTSTGDEALFHCMIVDARSGRNPKINNFAPKEL